MSGCMDGQMDGYVWDYSAYPRCNESYQPPVVEEIREEEVPEETFAPEETLPEETDEIFWNIEKKDLTFSEMLL